MKVFNHTKQSKKLILVIVCIMLFSFCCPTKVHAGLTDDLAAAPCHMIYMMERGILDFLNWIFCDDEHQDDGTVYVSPETIIKGKFLLLNPNIFDTGAGGDYYDDGNMKGGDPDASSISEGRKILRETIAGWYYALRNLAIVALLSILVYVGIRMLMTSISQDKAKYKMMLKDWLIALCLLFAMHYIMLGILHLADMVTNAIGTTGTNINLTDDSMDKLNHILFKDYENKGTSEWSDNNIWEINNVKYTLSDAYAYALLLAAIVGYTLIFAVKYLMRAIRIIFLILLAPISCITYPIDKISDGKAQAYNRWFQEFFYTIIIQPFHLLIYIVLVGSANTLARTNILYAIMCFAVMIPAEKFIKEMFGFKDKLGSPLGAFASGAIGSHLMNMVRNSGSKSDKNEKLDNESTPDNLPPRTTNDSSDLVDGNGSTRDNAEQRESSNTELGTGNDTQEERTNTALNGGDGSQEETDTALNGGDGSQEETDTALNEGDDTQEDDSNTALNDEGDSQVGDTKDNINESNAKDTMKKQGKLNKALSIHNQRVSKKYGSTRRGKRWLRRAGKGVKALAKGGLKAGVVLAVGTGAIMTGNVGKGVGLIAGSAAASAYKHGKRAIKGAKGAVKDYNQGLSGDKRRERQAFNKYEENKTNQDNTVMSFRKKHRRDPDYKEFQSEMKDRFTLSRYGLTEDQIDDALPIYQEMKDELLKNGKTKEDAERIAASKTKQSNQINKGLKPKDYRDHKTMQQTVNSLSKMLQEKTGCSDEIANKYAQQYLINAGRMAGLDKSEIVLPTSNQTIDIPLTRRTAGVANSLGIAGSEYTEEQASAVHNLNVRLHDAGYSDSEINVLAQSCANSSMNTDGVISNFENIVNASVEYMNDGNARNDAEKLVKAINHTDTASKADIDSEMRDRFILKTTMGYKNEKDVSAVRSLETSQLEITDKQLARNYAKKNKGRIKNGQDMTEQKKELENELREKAGLSAETAKDKANQIHDFATGIYNNPSEAKNKK